MDEEITQVVFYLYPEGDVMAYFPLEDYDTEGFYKVCYAHIGQHSACHPEYVLELTPAEPEQYAELKKELESIGYKLQVL
jgi:hypothetical protein